MPAKTTVGAEVAGRVPGPLGGVGHHGTRPSAEDGRDVGARVGHDLDAGASELCGHTRRPRGRPASRGPWRRRTRRLEPRGDRPAASAVARARPASSAACPRSPPRGRGCRWSTARPPPRPGRPARWRACGPALVRRTPRDGSAASGVTPTTWNIATAPDEAAAAPRALSWSSVASSMPSMTGIAVPTCRPTRCPSSGKNVSRRRHRVRHALDLDQDRAQAALVGVQPELRHEAGDRGADVDEVAVALGARAEHAVGEDDGVRLRPGDLLAEGRALVELVRRTRPGFLAAHGGVVPDHLVAGRGYLRGPAEQLRMQEVDDADVERGRDRDGRPALGQRASEVERRRTVVEATVDVGARDGDEARRLDPRRQAFDEPDRQAASVAASPLRDGPRGV